MVERDAFGPGSGGTAPGQADGGDGGSAGGLAAAGDVLDGAGDAGGDESVASAPDADDSDALAGLDDAFGGGDSGVADLYDLRLTALLHQLVRRRGHKGAARELGVNPRTVAGSVKQGMSRRVWETLERMLVDLDGEARDRLEDEMEGVKVEVSGMKEQVAGLESELREGIHAWVSSRLRDCGVWSAGWPRRRPGRAVQRGGLGGCHTPAPGAGGLSSRRRYPELVTGDPAGDDEEIFGDAWPLVKEWRELWDGHPARGKGLVWVSRRERILALEVALLEDHGLTLPPETEPLRAWTGERS